MAACRWGSVVIPWQTSVNSMAVLSLTYHNCSEMVSSSVANHISEGRAVSESSLVQISEKQCSSMGSAVSQVEARSLSLREFHGMLERGW